MVTVRKKFATLLEISEIHNPNNKYKTFVIAHIEAAAKCRVPWKSVRKDDIA